MRKDFNVRNVHLQLTCSLAFPSFSFHSPTVCLKSSFLIKQSFSLTRGHVNTWGPRVYIWIVHFVYNMGHRQYS